MHIHILSVLSNTFPLFQFVCPWRNYRVYISNIHCFCINVHPYIVCTFNSLCVFSRSILVISLFPIVCTSVVHCSFVCVNPIQLFTIFSQLICPLSVYIYTLIVCCACFFSFVSCLLLLLTILYNHTYNLNKSLSTVWNYLFH